MQENLKALKRRPGDIEKAATLEEVEEQRFLLPGAQG